jgi:hypothetical protein
MNCRSWLWTIALAGGLPVLDGCGAKPDSRVATAPRGAEATKTRAASNERSEPRDHALAMAKQYGHLEIDDIPPFPKRILVSLSDRRAVDEVLPLLQHVPDLTILNVLNVTLTEQDLKTIGGMASLGDLTLGTCGINDELLASLSTMKNLRRLHLNANPITDDGLKHLSPCVNLEMLGLAYTRVEGAGLEHVPSALRHLALNHTFVNDDTISHCRHFRRLDTLYLLDTSVTGAGLMKLVDMHWLLTVGPPKSIPKDVFRRFREAQKASTEAARAAGEDTPAGPGIAVPKEVL